MVNPVDVEYALKTLTDCLDIAARKEENFRKNRYKNGLEFISQVAKKH